MHAAFCILLLAFTLVQHNDPDYFFWMPVYGIPAVLAAIATWSPATLLRSPMRASIAVCTLLSAIGTVYFWPGEALFWHQAVWWQSESAREGIGMMIVTIALIVLAASAWRLWRKQPHQESVPG